MTKEEIDEIRERAYAAHRDQKPIGREWQDAVEDRKALINEVERLAKSLGDGLGRRELHPFILGLLETLPESGTEWNAIGRAKWLAAAARTFDLIYEGADEDIMVGVIGREER